MERVICVVIGYLVGALLQTGYWYGRLNHIDIRQYGSGNAGTTNAMRTLGKKAGAITYLVDALKAVGAAIIVHFVVGVHHSDIELVLIMYSGIGVVLGHNFPFYLGFKGGKGIAATSGVAVSLFLFPNGWIFTVLGIATFGGFSYATKYISVGSLVFATSFLVEIIVMGQLGMLHIGGVELIEVYAQTFFITALAFVRHRANIVRLCNGTERKIGQKKTEETM